METSNRFRFFELVREINSATASKDRPLEKGIPAIAKWKQPAAL